MLRHGHRRPDVGPSANNFEVGGAFEAAFERWTVTSSSAVNLPRFYKAGEYGLFNLAADWKINDALSLFATVKNIGDGD